MISLVTIDTRIVDLDYIQKHSDMIEQDHRITFFGTKENESHVKEAYPDINFVVWDLKEPFEIQRYNELLITEWFWNQIPDEYILIFHPDSGILKKGIEKFFYWDYVGAPWGSPKWGGNGGLSIRKKSISLQCIKMQPEFTNWTNEDGYFCDLMKHKKIGNLAPREVCSEFACETIFHLGTYGYHRINGYMSEDQVNQIMNQYV